MLKVTLKGLRANSRRLVTTSISVMLGVAFIVGTYVLTDTIKQTFNDLFTEVNEGIDAVVRKEAAFDDQFMGEQRGLVDADLVDTVDALPETGVAEGQVQGYAQFVDADGDAIGNPATGAPTFGFNWSDNQDLNPYVLVEGEAPGDGEVVADRLAATEGDFEVGDEVQVITQTGVNTLTLSGIATFGDQDSAGGTTAAMFDVATAQELLGTPGEFTEIWVTAADGVSQEQLADAIQGAVPQDADLEVLTGEAYNEATQDSIQEALGFFTAFLSIFGFIALFVAFFIIYNTFTIIVAQRSRELALLRAVGAGRGQVVGSVLLEALVVGLVASILGLFAGIALSFGLRGLLDGIGFELPSTGTVVLPRTVLIAFLCGTLVCLLSSVAPAVRASRVPPIAAMRDIAIDRAGHSTRRLVIGLVVLALGLVLMALGLFGDGGISGVGFGAAITFIGLFVLSARLAVPVVTVLGWPVARWRGEPGKLARQNALRNPKRSANTASALTIGLCLVVIIATLGQSTKTSAFESIDDSFQGNLAISSGTFGFGGLPPELAEQVQALPEVGHASGLRINAAQIGPSPQVIVGVDPAQMFDIVDVDITEGDPASLEEVGTVALEQEAADSVGWGIGTMVPVTFAGSGDQQLRVTMLFEDDQALGGVGANYIVGIDTWDANFDQKADASIFIEYAEGVDPAEARAAVEQVADQYPTAEVQNLDELKESQAAQINQFLGLVYVLLFLAIFIAAIGIANTLALSIYERTRELGLLRAVGMTRSQLKTSIRWEAVIISLFGTILGLVVGLALAFALQQAVKDEGVNVFDVPWGQVVIIVVIGALIGVISAVRPAKRASKMDVLDAISSP
jgi:putative ABC transport system permease protein